MKLFIIAFLFLSLAACVPPASARSDYDDRSMKIKDDHVRAGKIYYNIRMYEKAAEQWERALEIDPRDKRVAALWESAKKRLEAEAKPEAVPEKTPLVEEKRIEEPAPKEETVAPAPREEAILQEKAAEPVVEKKEEISPKTEAAKERKVAEKEPVPGPVAGRALPGEPIVVNGDKVEYFHEKKQVIGSGNVSITYKDVVMTCDKITVYLDTREGIAEGNVKITQKDAYFTGERINYNFDTKVGRVIDGYVNTKPFYGKAQEIDKLTEKEFVLNRGSFTTCDLEKPHYRIQSKEVKIYLDDKVVAKHIVAFIGNTPVLYFPYYVQPLKERSTHIAVIAGKESDWGYYALNSVRYYFSDIAKGRFRIDYRTKKGLAVGIDNYHNTKELGSGSAKFYFIKEYDYLAADRPEGAEASKKHRIQVRHRWDITDDTQAVLEFNKVRDQNFLRDYFYTEYQEVYQPDNYISVITTKDNYTTSLLIRKRIDKYYNVTERLPEYKIDIPNYRFFKEVPIYYKAEASGVYLNNTYTKTVPEQKDVSTIRFDTYNQLSYATRIFRSLSVTPYVGARQTYYSRNRWGDTNLVRGVFQAGIDSSIKFYKIYDVETSFLGLDIHKLRHIVTPTANYYYTYQPTISPDNLNQFDYIDAIDKANHIILSLENKLQTKRPEGDGKLKSVDLATFIISTDYLFRFKKDNVSEKEQRFNNVNFQLELSPYPWMFILSKATVDTKNQAIQTYSLDLTASKDKDWWITAGHRYESVSTGKSNLATLDCGFKISPKWRVRAYERFNIDKRAPEEQEYGIIRDLHCWEAELAYNIKQQDTRNNTFWFILRLKAFPEVQLGLRREYAGPRAGASQPSTSSYRIFQ